MRKATICTTTFIVGFLTFSSSLSAGVLTFDETPGLVPWAGGLLADGFSIPAGTLTAGAATAPQPTVFATAKSGSQAMYNHNRRQGRIVRSSEFDLVGAYFKQDDRLGVGSSTFLATGYDSGGTLLFSSSHTLTGTWTFITLNMNGISDFRFDPITPDVQNMVMDDLTYNEASSSTVPEPASAMVFGVLAGLVGLTGRRRTNRPSQLSNGI